MTSTLNPSVPAIARASTRRERPNPTRILLLVLAIGILWIGMLALIRRFNANSGLPDHLRPRVQAFLADFVMPDEVVPEYLQYRNGQRYAVGQSALVQGDMQPVGRWDYYTPYGRQTGVGLFDARGNGVRIWWNLNNVVQTEEYFHAGEEVATALFHDNGQRQRYTPMLNDQPHGVEELYDDQGRVVTRRTWHHGIEQGWAITFDRGKAVRSQLMLLGQIMRWSLKPRSASSHLPPGWRSAAPLSNPHTQP